MNTSTKQIKHDSLRIIRAYPTICKCCCRLGMVLFELLSESLGLDKNHLKDIYCHECFCLLAHYYLVCPGPELTPVSAQHTDSQFLLHDQIGGLRNSLADNIVVQDIAFANTYKYTTIHQEDNKNPWTQAVAAKISGDKMAFYDVTFMSVQDTLFDDNDHHYFFCCIIIDAMDNICPFEKKTSLRHVYQDE